MGDKPIIFSAPMVRALMDWRKTQTRRVLKPQPKVLKNGIWYRPYPVLRPLQWEYLHGDRIAGFADTRYAHGDRLWVREAHYMTYTGDYEIAVYAEDANAVREHFDLINSIAAQHNLADTWKAPHLRLRSPIHMPRWASRLTLTVTDVRVQRLQEISEADAWAEGCRRGDATDNGGYFPADETDPSGIGWRGWDCACDWYADLWNSLHGAGAWEANPWVAAYSFAVQHGNIDTQGDPQ